MQIASQTGLNPATVKAALDLYKSGGGDAALMPGPRGRKQGAGRALSAEHEASILQLVRTRRPCFFKLTDLLWTRDSVAQLIEERLGIKLSVRGASNYLTRWGIVLKNPSQKPYERCTGEVQKWLDVNYVDVERQAQLASAEIYWLNKPVPLDASLWTGTAAMGVVASESSMAAVASAKKLRMISAINAQGTLRWAIIDGAFNSARQIKFVTGLLKDANGSLRKPLFLIQSDAAACNSRDFLHWHATAGFDVRVFP